MSVTLQLALRTIEQRQPAGSWERVAALLLRQAIEEAELEYWTMRELPEMGSASQRHQLIALSVLLQKPPTLAADVRHAWNRLSTACHANARIVLPDADELLELAATVEALEHAEVPS